MKRKIAKSALVGILVCASIFSTNHVFLNTSYAITNEDIIVYNNLVGKTDIVEVSGVVEGDLVKVYDASAEGKLLGKATVVMGRTKVKVSINQLGMNEGKVYVTITSPGQSESEPIEVAYISEPMTDMLEVGNITIKNNVLGTADTIKLTKVAAGDMIKIYDSEALGKMLGSGVVMTGKNEIVISVPQIGKDGGKIYLTKTVAGKNESPRIAAEFEKEPVSDNLKEEDITIDNNSRVADTIKVINVKQEDIIKVYNQAEEGKVIGTTTVATGKKETVLNIPQLGVDEGKVYITVTNKGKWESTRIEKAYGAEQISNAPDENKILAINNKGTDVIVVYGLQSGDIVKIYSSEAEPKVLATSVVKPKQSQVIINLQQLGIDGGSIFVTVSTPKKMESPKVEKKFDPEVK